jgi:hypothetical protein
MTVTARLVLKRAAWAIALVTSIVTIAYGQGNAGAVFGAFGNIMNQAIQQQQQQQQQQLYYQQQQQQQQRLQQQQLDLQRQHEMDRQYQIQREQAQEKARERAAAQKERADAQRRQRDAVAEAAREKARTAAETKAKMDREAQAAAAAEQRQLAEAEARRVRGELLATLVVSDILGPATEDITVLIAARDTPRVIRNLSGDPMFVKSPAICFPFGPPSMDTSTQDGRFLLATISQITKKGGGKVVIPGDCTSGSFGPFDLLLFSRKEIESTDQPPDRIRPVLLAIREGAFVKFGIYLHADFLAESETRRQQIEDDEQRRTRERTRAKEQFQTRDDDVISVIYLKSPAPAVCLTAPTESGLAALLASEDSPYLDVVDKMSTTKDTSTAPAIFLALKTRDCLAAAGPTKILREVVAGLDRDGILFDYHAKSIPISQMSKWKVRANAVAR